MNMLRKTAPLLIGWSMGASLYAFDGTREGFFIAAGVGMSYTSHQPYREHAYTGVGTSQKIGYGLSEQLIVHLSREDAWFDYDGDLSVSCIPGVGVTYYMSEETNALFLSTTLGVGSFNTFHADEAHYGGGIAFSIGYEWMKHINTEVTWMVANIETKQDRIDPMTFKFGVSYSWY